MRKDLNEREGEGREGKERKGKEREGNGREEEEEEEKEEEQEEDEKEEEEEGKADGRSFPKIRRFALAATRGCPLAAGAVGEKGSRAEAMGIGLDTSHLIWELRA